MFSIHCNLEENHKTLFLELKVQNSLFSKMDYELLREDINFVTKSVFGIKSVEIKA